MAAKSTARVRMYRLNELGDCFLLSFAIGGNTSHLLIDCGSFRNNKESVKRLESIVADIGKTLKGAPLNVVVGTHQHNDHLSGFVHCESQFRTIGIDQVWLSWLDNPSDARARKIGEAHHNLRQALASVRERLRMGNRAGVRALGVLNEMLGFYGAADPKSPPELPAKAVEILKEIGKAKPDYLKPGRTLEMPGLPAGSVRIHVLGPPLADDDLNRKDPRKGESYDQALAKAGMSVAKLLSAVEANRGMSLREEANYPFGERYKLKERSAVPAAHRKVVSAYRRKEETWRTIDDDWLNQAEGLALFMDEFTNNSSLAVAIELCASGKVLLFAADAQTGNWTSWKNVEWKTPRVKTEELLANTVLYKVGHHASHNATLVEAFEKMNDPSLMALIPVHKKDPNITKKNGWKMPARNLFKRISEKTSNRVLQMDNVNPAACDPNAQPAKGAWKRASVTPKITSMYIEVEISDT